MVEFFRDVLSGPLYIITSVISIILIMAIIGFIMERKKLEKEHNEEVAFVSNVEQPVTPIEPVKIEEPVQIEVPVVEQKSKEESTLVLSREIPNEKKIMENLSTQPETSTTEVKPPIIVFEDNTQN